MTVRLRPFDELEERKNEITKTIDQYDRGDKDLAVTLSSQAVQNLEDELNEIEHEIWKYSFYKEMGIGARYINACIEDSVNDIAKDSGLIGRLVNNESLDKAKDESQVGYGRIQLDEFLFQYMTLSNMNKGLSLILAGNTGTGKTHLAASIAFYFIEKLKPKSSAFFIQMSDLVSLFNDRTYGINEKIDNIRNKGLLIVDDMAAEKTWDNVIEDVMQRIFRYRYNSALPTISTTNLYPLDFVKKYGDRHKSVFCGKDHLNVLLLTKKDIRLEGSN